MITIEVKEREFWDPVANVFVYTKGGILQLEHSLRAIQKWEAKYMVPFISTTKKTTEQTLYYIECMTLNEVEDKSVYSGLTEQNLKDISDYIESPMTATTIKKSKKGARGGSFITAEVLYYYMVAAQIPFECADWHLNQLLTLLEVYGEKSNPKKMSKRDVYKNYDAINEARKAKYGIK